MDQNFICTKLQSSKIEYKADVPLKELTSFQVGGNAAIVVYPKSIDELTSCIKTAEESAFPTYVIGNGSNILASDAGFFGMVISTRNLNSIKVIQNSIICGSGVMLSAFCKKALEKNLSGMEFAWGIPGTIGGAIYMNAGAYGGEIQDVLKSVTYYENGEIFTASAGDLELSYRHSIFQEKNAIILSGEFELSEGINADIKSKMDCFLSKRKEKQPLEFPSAGSTFKRPVGNYAAALIEQSGLRGYQVGGAKVSEKHCGFVINYDNASCNDILSLIADVKKIVKEKTDYQLECEIKTLGEMPDVSEV